MIQFSRHEVTQMSWECYSHIVETWGAGDWNRQTDTVAWPMSDAEWCWLLLKYPELIKARNETCEDYLTPNNTGPTEPDGGWAWE